MLIQVLDIATQGRKHSRTATLVCDTVLNAYDLSAQQADDGEVSIAEWLLFQHYGSSEAALM